MLRTSRGTLQREKHTRRLAPMSMKLLDYPGTVPRAKSTKRCPVCRDTNPRNSCPGSSGLAYLQPEIGRASLNLDGSAHLVQAGPHSFTDPIPQRVLGDDRSFSTWRVDFLLLHVVEIVGGNDGATRMGQISRSLHISFVQNITHGVSDPIGRFNATEIIEHQHFGRKNRF